MRSLVASGSTPYLGFLNPAAETTTGGAGQVPVVISRETAEEGREDQLGSLVADATIDRVLVGIEPEFPTNGDQKHASSNATSSLGEAGCYFLNDPHPVLETPLLYFLLRPFPKVLDKVQFLYTLRWKVSYPLQNRVPCSRQLSKVGIFLSWSDILLLLPFMLLVIKAIWYTFFDPSVSITGHTARTPLIFAFVTAMKNNFLTVFLGMPVERAIKYHNKLSARLAYINSILHTYVAFARPDQNGSQHTDFLSVWFQDSLYSGGSMLLLFMTGMIVTALPTIRRKLFELFYYLHIIFAICMMACAYYHTGVLIPILASLTWGLDLVARKVYMPFFRYPRKATLKVISETVVEVSFPKSDGFDFNPGQYIYLAVPKLGHLQWHPFSLSSSPRQRIVTLHIRKSGNWTASLYKLAMETLPGDTIDILMEGPYGSVGVDLRVNKQGKYQNIMLISGGIGVTPMQSLCNSLMYERNKSSRELRKLSFIWIERGPVVVPEVDVIRRKATSRPREDSVNTDIVVGSENPSSISHHDNLHESALYHQHDNSSTARDSPLLGGIVPTVYADGSTEFATQLMAFVPPSRETDAELERVYPSISYITDRDHDSPFMPENSPAAAGAVATRGTTTKSNNKGLRFDIEEAHSSWLAGEEVSADQSFFNEAFGESPALCRKGEEKSSPLDLQVYLTSKHISAATKTAVSKEMPFVHFFRPDMKKVFHDARRDVMLSADTATMTNERESQPQIRVAVCVCAPLRIVNLVRQACATYSDHKVTFDVHNEVFE